MDPGDFFGSVSARLTRFVQRRRRRLPDATAAVTENEQTRLKLVAGMLAGRPLDIRITPGLPGYSGRIIFLPEYIDLWPDYELNRRALLYCTLYSVAQRQLNIRLSSARPAAVRVVAETLLTVRPLLRLLEQEFPGMGALHRQLQPDLLATRPQPDTLQGAGVPLEALVQALLGRDPASLSGSLTGADRDWLQQALRCRRFDPGSIDRLVRALESIHGGSRYHLPGPVILWGQLADNEAAAADGDTAGTADGGEPVQKPKHVIDSRRHAGKIESVEWKQKEDTPLFHNFEKIETAEEHSGEARSPDSSGEKTEDEDSLSELSLSHVIRTADQTDSLYRFDAVIDGAGALAESESADETVSHWYYDEWDWKKRRYRQDWCTLYEARPGPAGGDAARLARQRLALYRKEVKELRHQLEVSLWERVTRNRQLEGEEIDIDATVDYLVDRSIGHTPRTRLYLQQRRGEQDLAVWLLLDNSLSSDSWVDNRRILDVERDSVLILGEVFSGFIDRVGIAAFSTRTRNHCDFTVLKDFDQDWSRARLAVMSLEPRGYTRIGPAIRHASSLLAGQPARRKALIVITDGQPTDYDRYEGKYGIEDVAQAVREAGADHIRCHGLAIARHARPHLAVMFGPGRYDILTHPGELPAALTDLFLRLRP